MNKLALITTIVLAVLTVAPSTTEAVDVERDALMALFDSTGGPNWTDNTGWGAGYPCDSAWHGLTCGADGVTWLDLSYNQLSGPIPAELGNLSSLVGLALNNNQLSGSIPAELGNPSSFGYLDLSYNQLSGSIPAELGNLSNLQLLELHSNQLGGPIPTDLGNLSNMRQLYLHNNSTLVCWQSEATLTWAQNLPKYNGPLMVCTPDIIGLMALYDSTDGANWTVNTGWGDGDPCLSAWYGVTCDTGVVTQLDLFSNQLSGPIPAELGNLSSLQELNLYNNQLSGLIPTELDNLSSLSALYLDSNPALECWQTQEALDWALELEGYLGPQLVCGAGEINNNLYIPLIMSGG